MAKTYKNYPEAVSNNAKRGIKLNEEVNNRCATQVGKVRARQLANREAITYDTVKRMYSYLSRAEEYYDESDTKACGTISYLLWGGLAGKRWSKSIIDEEEKIMSSTLLHKSFEDTSMLIKDIDGKKGIVSGYFSKFGNVDRHNDIMAKGCYAKSIAENGPQAKGRIAHLWSHSSYEPIGKLQELNEDDFGLYFVSKIVDSAKGRDVMAYYEAGIVNEHSVGFSIVKEAYEGDDADEPTYKRVRTITEAKLWEGSSVVIGANPETPTISVKDASEEEVKSLIDRLGRMQKQLRNGSKMTDEAFIQLEIECTQIQKALSSLVTEEPQKHSKETEPNLLEIWEGVKVKFEI